MNSQIAFYVFIFYRFLTFSADENNKKKRKLKEFEAKGIDEENSGEQGAPDAKKKKLKKRPEESVPSLKKIEHDNRVWLC